MIFHCLRYWVHNYHVDGFRFDLASILSRNREGELVPNPPVVESIGEDPLLADTEDHRRGLGRRRAATRSARSAACAGRNGTATTATTCGDSGAAIRAWSACWPRGWPDRATCTRPAAGEPYHSINFITSHDGFTLNDLVSYSEKHNEANGEENRDGESNNYSYNYGVEGPTRRAAVETVRLRQIKNLMASLLLSQGVPMLLGGRRMPPHASRQQQRLLPGQRDLLVRLAAGRASTPGCGGSAQSLVAFRRAEPTVRQTDFLRGQSRRPGELARRKLVQPQRRAGRLVRAIRAAWSACWRRPPREVRLAAESSRADAHPRRHRFAALHPAAARAACLGGYS